MADKLFLELISPEKTIASMEVDSVVATGSCGEIGILPGHSAFLTSLKIGGFTYTAGSNVAHIALSEGFMEVSDDKVIVLAESAESGKDINIQEAKDLKAEAEKVAEESKGKDEEAYQKAIKDVEYQNARIDAVEKSK